MKHVKRALALVLALVLLLTPMVGVGSAETGAGAKTLVVFDLEGFLNGSLTSEQARYDYFKFATALQGLVNRDEPHLYYFSFTNGAAAAAGYDMDEYWFNKITDEKLGYGELAAGGDLADYEIVEVKSFWKLVKMFEEYYNGLVVWESDVPSSANVASTIAGVENLLPVRKAMGAEDLYAALMRRGFTKEDIKRDLTGLFTGEGYIPTLGSSVPGAKVEYTSTPSTGSKKTDPYIWAKLFYLDTGLTNPLHMTYSIDAGGNRIKAAANKADKDSGEGVPYDAEWVSLYVPEKMAVGEVLPVKFTFMNTGTESWNNDLIRLGVNGNISGFQLYIDEACTKMVTSDMNRLTMGYCAPGEMVTVTGYMRAPYAAGDYSIPFAAVFDGQSWFSSIYYANVKVTKGGGMTEEEKNSGYLPMNAETAVYTSSEAEIVKVSAIDPSVAGTATVTIRNVSITEWNDVKLNYTINGNAKTPVAVNAVEVGEEVTVDIAYPAADMLTFELQLTADGEDVGEGYEFEAVKGQTAAVAEDYAAEVISWTYPKNILRGDKGTIKLEIKNTGKKTWQAGQLVAQSTQSVLSTASVSDDSSAPVDKINGESVAVAPGASYFFNIDMHSGYGKSWTEPGNIITQTLSVKVGSTELVSLPMTTMINDETIFNFAEKSLSVKNTTVSGYSAQLVSYALPAAMNVGDAAQPFRVTFKNNGTETWTGESGAKIRFGIDNKKTAEDPQQDAMLYHDEALTKYDGSWKNRLYLPSGFTVEPGQTFTVCGFITPPSAGGLQQLNFYMVKESQPAAVIGDSNIVPFVITDPNAPASLLSLEETPDAELAVLEEPMLAVDTPTNGTITWNTDAEAAVTTATNHVTFLSAKIAGTVEAGKKVPISITVKNTGTGTIRTALHGYPNLAHDDLNAMRLVFTGDAGWNAANFNTTTQLMKDKFLVLSTESWADKCRTDTGVTWLGAAEKEYDRMDMPASTTFTSGNQYTFNGFLVAPSTPGTYTLTLNARAGNLVYTQATATQADPVNLKITVTEATEEPDDSYETIYEDTATVTEPAAAAWGARIKKVEMGSTDKTVAPGAKVPVKITVENIGKDTPLYSAATVVSGRKKLIVDGSVTLNGAQAFGATRTSGVYSDSPVFTAAEGHVYLNSKFYALSADGGDQNVDFHGTKINGRACGDLNQYGTFTGKADKFGDTMVINAYLIAPKTEGDYVFKFRGYELNASNAVLGNTNYTTGVTVKVSAGTTPPVVEEPTFTPAAEEVVFKTSAQAPVDSSKDWAAEILSAAIPSVMAPGAIVPVTVTVKNTGAKTWKSTADDQKNEMRLALNPQVGFEMYNDAAGTKYETSGKNRIQIEKGKEVKSGETYTYKFYLKAPAEGGQTLKPTFALIGERQQPTHTGWLGARQFAILLETVIKTDAQAPVTTADWAGEILSASIPKSMEAESIVPVTVTVKNTGTKTWKSSADNLQNEMRLALNTQVGFEMYTDAAGTKYDASGKNRIQIEKGKEVKSGETYTYKFYLKAPDTAATLTPTFALIGERQQPTHTGWLSVTAFTILVSKPYVPNVPVYTEKARDAQIVTASISPNPINVNEQGSAVVVVKNIGTETWGQNFYLRYRVNKGDAVYLPVSSTVAPGELATFTFNYEAPSQEKTFNVEASMLYNADLAAKKPSKYFGDSIVLEGICTAPTTSYATIVSTNLPTSILEGTKAEAYVEVLNTGNVTWGSGNTVTLSPINKGAKGVFSAIGVADDEMPTATIALPEGVTVAPGERYVFRFDVHTWELVNKKLEFIRSNTTVDLQMRLSITETGKEAAYMAEAFDATFKTAVYYEDPEWTELTSLDKTQMTGKQLSAEFLAYKVPTKMAMGQLVPFAIRVRNTGTITWREATNAIDGVRLATQSASGLFGFYKNAEASEWWSGDKNRVQITGRVASGDVYEFSGFLKAPTQAGTYTLDLKLINDSSTPLDICFNDDPILMLEIEVIGNSVFQEEFVEIGGAGVTYGDLTQTAVGNADYYIAKKAFFWDLAVDPTIAPLDDRGQTPGTDRRVLRELLNSQRKRAQAYEEGRDPWNKVAGVGEGFGIFTVGGFTPWFRKYCNYEDNQSSWAPVDAEWATIDITSEYGGQTDADAYGTITVSNCSVFSLLKNNVQKFGKNLTQTQPDFDPAVGDPTVKYNPNTKYILHYMGDWDGSAWISGILATLWENDPRRGEIPVGWALATANSERIPHVYNWQYDNATPNDYFFFGDNGPAYFNPSWTEDPTTESGITKAEGHEMTQDFINYTKYYADLFSLDITGFFITGTYTAGPEKHKGADSGAMQAFAEATPYGVGTQANAANVSYYGSSGIETQFIEVKSLGSGLVTEADRVAAAKNFESAVKFGKQFVIFRTVKATVTRILQAQEIAEKNNPNLNYKVVDPYTFFRLAREAGAYDSEANKANYDAKRASDIKIDGQIGAAEWADAAVMTISPNAKEIGEHGYNWAPAALASDADMEAKFRVKWDNEYLYVLEERSDDGEGPTADTRKIDWTADSGAIYLDTDGKWSGSTYYAGDFAVMFNRDAAGVPNVWLRKGSDEGKRSERKLNEGEYIAAVSKTDSGYVYELAIKWSAIGAFRPTWGKTVGMTLLAIDGDPGLMGGARQIMWHGNGDAQENWGKMTFK